VNTVNGNMALNQDFKEFLKLLNVNEVQYLMVGRYSVAFLGNPRYTKDQNTWRQKKIKKIVAFIF
jgi:hypothetical protein